MPNNVHSTDSGDHNGKPPRGPISFSFEPEDNRPIELLEPSVRSYNCLKRAEITTIGRLMALTKDQLLGIRNFGRSGYDEIRAKLIEFGIMDADNPMGPFAEPPPAEH